MNIPGHDDWRLSGPDDDTPDMEECVACDGTGRFQDGDGYFECLDCGGSGEVPVPHDEPDADYLRDLRDDR